MKSTYEKCFNKLIAIFLIIILTSIDFISIGINFASFAVDVSNLENENIRLNAYFKDVDGKNTIKQEIDLNAQEIKIYVDIAVLKEGYFEGKISLEDSNLVIIGATENEYISNIEGNTINLNHINSGKRVILELKLKPNTGAKMNIDILNKETIVKLEGKYINSKGEDNIQDYSKINAIFVSPKDVKSISDIKVLTNKIFEIDGKNKRILQFIVRSKIAGNVYPVQRSSIELNLPQDAEIVDVIARNTSGTSKNINFGKNNYIYNIESSKLKINLENLKDEEENISFEQNGKDEFVVTCVYAENTILTKETQIDLAQEILTYDNKLLKSDKNIYLGDQIDGIVNYELVQEENELYKGKIYTGEERNYKLIATSYINSTKVDKNIKFNLNDTKYIVGEEKKAAKVLYKEIKINKEQFDIILGKEGYICIKDATGDVIQNITKETEFDQNGNIAIQIPNDVYILELETSKAIQTGKIDFEILKTIKEDKYSNNEIKSFEAIENSITLNGQVLTKQIVLKETQSEAKLSLDNTTLRAGENENLQMRVVLLTDDESKELYKNPTVKIEFPEDVSEVSAKYKTLYLNGLEKNSAVLKEENDKKVIEVSLSGEQQEYQGDAIEGTEILINANVKMNKLMANSTENIMLTYTNEGGTEQGNSRSIVQEINVIQNEKFIVTNNIEELDIETSGEEENKNIYLEPSDNSKEVTVKIGAINNEGENLQDVKILGSFPTPNSINTMDIAITNGIEVTSQTANVKIYYSNKEDVTEDLADANNGWTEDVTLENKKSYLILIPSFNDGESFNAQYGINIMRNVDENKIASEDFAVIYSKQNSSDITRIKSTSIILNIKCLPDSITATIEGTGNGSILKSGNIYLYRLNLKNNTDNEIRDIQLKVCKNELLEINQSFTNEIPENGIVNITKLEAGEEKSIDIFVKCLNKNHKDDKAIIYAEINTNEERIESNKYICEIEDISAKVSIDSKAYNNEEGRNVGVGDKIDYEIKVENTCLDDLKNLQVKSTMTSFLKVQKVTIDGEEIDFNEKTEGENNKYRVIDFCIDVNAGQVKKIIVSTKVEGEIIISSLNDITNFTQVLYNSSLLDTKTDEGFNIKNGESINIEENPGNGEENYNSEIQDNNDGNNSNGNSDNNIGNNENYEVQEEKFKITGNVWLDEQEKGDKSFSNKKINGVKVKLIEENGNVVKNELGKGISAQTDNNGYYVLENIPKGKYIVIFEYDSQKYKLSEYQKDGVEESNNSDAIIKDIVIDGTKSTVAATDILELRKDILNIDLGLIENKKFDLELEKNVEKITVTNNKGIREYLVKDKTLAKVEIDSKQLNNSKVKIDYIIKVKNTGDISGYVKNIVDYMPNDTDFNPNLNNGWSKKGEYLYNSSLSDEKIDPGQEKEIRLILEKTITELNTGLVSNTAEIVEAQSSTGAFDVDSTPNNRKDGEDDLGQADVIIGVNTGTVLKYIILTICILTMLGLGIFLINEKVLKV